MDRIIYLNIKKTQIPVIILMSFFLAFNFLLVTGNIKLIYEYPLKSLKLACCGIDLKLHKNNSFNTNKISGLLIWRSDEYYTLKIIEISNSVILNKTNTITNEFYYDIKRNEVFNHMYFETNDY